MQQTTLPLSLSQPLRVHSTGTKALAVLGLWVYVGGVWRAWLVQMGATECMFIKCREM